MKKILGFLMLLLLGGTAFAAVTSIAQLPLLNITGTGNVKPNLMLLYDNSGSMSYAFTPDYVDDNSTCRSRATMGGGTRGCSVGQPPFNSSDFNRQYYDPKVTYTPPVKSDGTSYASMTSANTSKWTSVTTDGFGVNTKDLLGASASSTSLVDSSTTPPPTPIRTTRATPRSCSTRTRTTTRSTLPNTAPTTPSPSAR
jgi:type IV pilus assembly protein PilY1